MAITLRCFVPGLAPMGAICFGRLTSDLVRRQLETLATGVTRFGLRTDAIGGVEFPLPPLGEQRAIADYLDTETARIDALITKKRRLITLLEEAWSAEVVERTLGNPWLGGSSEGW